MRVFLALAALWLSGVVAGYLAYGSYLEYRVIERGVMIGTQRIFGGPCGKTTD